MAQAPILGYDSYVGFREISSTADLATVPAEFMFIDSISFKRTHEEQIQAQEIGIGDRSPRRRVIGNVSAAGSFTKNVDVSNGIGLYKHLLSGSLTSASVSTATWTHTFAEGDDVDSPSNITRLLFEASYGGNSATTYRWFNGVVESYSLNVAVNAPTKETFNMRFADHTATPINTISTVALTQTDPINFNRCTVKLGSSITTTSIVATKDITLNINNDMIENREIGTNTVADFRFGARSIDGSFVMTFENDMNTYQDFINNTYLALEIVLESTEVTSTTNHSITWKFPKVYVNGETPDVSDINEITQPINFSAIYGSEAGYMVQNVVLNTAAAVTL
jgi:hypothetical protein